MPAKPKEGTAWSVPALRRIVLELLAGLDWKNARVCDVGAGSGALARLLADYLNHEHALQPEGRIVACDADTSSFEAEGVECLPTAPDGSLPFEDGTFDATISMEVIEHVEDQFLFLRELKRVTKPGGRVIVTTPNVLNVNSRLRTLLTGFPVLFDPLPLSKTSPRFLGGHIHPISPYFMGYGAHRAGLVDLELHTDRTKRSAMFLGALLAPLFLAGRALQVRRMRRKHPDVFAENRELIQSVSGWNLLTGRTAVLSASRPAEDNCA